MATHPAAGSLKRQAPFCISVDMYISYIRYLHLTRYSNIEQEKKHQAVQRSPHFSGWPEREKKICTYRPIHLQALYLPSLRLARASSRSLGKMRGW